MKLNEGTIERLLERLRIDRLERLVDRISLRLRLADRSLFVKFAAAPAAMLALLVCATIFSLAALLHAQAGTNRIVDQDMRRTVALAAVAARFERADGDIQRLLVARAASSDVDVAAQAAKIRNDLGTVRQQLMALRGDPHDRPAIDHVLTELETYEGAVDVVTAMLDVDFSASVSMLAPFREKAKEVVRDVNVVAAKGIADAEAHAAGIVWRMRLMLAVVVIATFAVALLGMLLTAIMGRTTVRSIRDIAEATTALAGADYTTDLDALDRGDELGAVVSALKTFRTQALESLRVHEEKIRLESEARAEDARRREAVGEATREAERERRATLERLARAFDEQVAGLIEAAQLTMGRLDESSERLDRSAEGNRILSGELQRLAEGLTGEMDDAGAATDVLTASIREIDHEVGRTSKVARSILSHAEKAQTAVAESEARVEDVGTIVDVIDDIARQTRLLALNATIEAARAGEIGRGFGVVASEIKSLSSRTGGSTQDVRRQVVDIQQGIGRIVEVTTQLGGLIEVMNGVASRVAEVSADQVRSTDEIDERIGAVRRRSAALVEASAAIRNSSLDNQMLVRELREAGTAMHESLARLGRDAQTFTAYLRAS